MKRVILFQAALLLALALSGCPQATGDVTEDETDGKLDPSWLITATPFMLKDETAVTNVKLTWPRRTGVNRYEVYRNGALIGHASGDTFDDYDLAPDATYQYSVKAFLGKTLTAASAEISTATFTPGVQDWIYKNETGVQTTITPYPSSPGGYKFGDYYYDYGWTSSGDDVILQGRVSTTGVSSWSNWETLATISTYEDPVDGPYSDIGAKLEAVNWHKVGDKVVMGAHREPKSGYNLGHFLLASFYPDLTGSTSGTAEVTFDGRPFDCDSRDQSIFLGGDGTAYALSSGLGPIYIFKLNEEWTEPVEHVNTIFSGEYRETPHILARGDTFFFFSSRQSGWYPSQTAYSTTTDMAGTWAPLTPVGNNVSNGSQFNRVQEFESTTREKTYGAWSYRWAAQWDSPYKEQSNIQRLSVLTFNGNFCASEYFSEVAYYSDYGLVGIQPGRYVSLAAPVTVSVLGSGQNTKPAFITDGGDMQNSGAFQGSEYPYDAVIDLGSPAVLKEINITSRNTGGSETAYQYQYNVSNDGETWTLLLDKTSNMNPGFTIDVISESTAYRYLKITIYDMKNVRNGNSATWAEGIIELAVFGTP
jgi:hypothetical protein